ncbi:hypothetical protein KIKIMORA_01530 [Brevundimonas phage vB_BpoS-Kikimora]|uniref:Uncharacterized protein n=1 Tax=Brevundimonas phage vB_BpoS-Kikimora TaxID=2948601 RepID=A0A9E7MRW6_9CAUD|nr:hypothetical protein KIKIMORA_01530 [Brevundimonas phage vB_BpoS-Kikimora]
MSAPLHSCPYANKAGMVIMHLVQTGRVDPKTGRVLYEVHLPTETARLKKLSRPLSLEDAGRAALENEKALGWDKFPAVKYEPVQSVLPASATEGGAGGSRSRAQAKPSERKKRSPK